MLTLDFTWMLYIVLYIIMILLDAMVVVIGCVVVTVVVLTVVFAIFAKANNGWLLKFKYLGSIIYLHEITILDVPLMRIEYMHCYHCTMDVVIEPVNDKVDITLSEPWNKCSMK